MELSKCNCKKFSDKLKMRGNSQINGQYFSKMSTSQNTKVVSEITQIKGN